MRQHGISAVLSADGQAFTGRGKLHGILVGPDGTNDVTVVLHDGTDATGTQVAPTFIAAGDGGLQGFMGFDIPIDTGVYVELSGGSPEAIVYYAPTV